MNLIPQPQEITYSDIHFYKLTDEAVLSVPEPDSRLNHTASAIFAKLLESQDSHGLYHLYTEKAGQSLPNAGCTAFSSPLKSDYYEISVAEEGLCISSPTAAGLFYGIQTLLQLMEEYGRALPYLHIRDWAETAFRCDHFDMRIIHPEFSHMLAYIREMAAFKINGLMIEYEDKLPFPTLKELRHPHGLTSEQLALLLQTAHENFIDVIPLQQTYGHLEYVLKHPEYIHLREQPNHVAELCPLKEGSYELVCRLLKDIATLHPNSKYLHLGGDEVWSIGTCGLCRNSGLSPAALFIQVMNRIAAYAIELGKQPIIWHDMLKTATDEELALLDKRITIAVWIYSGRHMKERALQFVTRFRKAGFAVLGAPSVRCWDDTADQNHPVVEKRLFNITQWLHIREEASLNGIIFTNWSASLALGNPYGLFETTRYLTFWGVEKAWNPSASQETYPHRFFRLYHGITDEAFLSDSFTFDDYYRIPDLYLPLCKKNVITAKLLDTVMQYDEALKTGLPLQDLLFQADLFPENEEIITFLREKYKENYEIWDRVRPVMADICKELLPGHLVPIYLHSRFFLPDLYRTTAQKLLKI